MYVYSKQIQYVGLQRAATKFCSLSTHHVLLSFVYAPQNKPSSFKENSNTLQWERRVFSVKSETKWKCSLYRSSNLWGDNRRALNRSSGCLSCFQSPVVEAFSICWKSWELKSFVPVSSKCSYWNCNGCKDIAAEQMCEGDSGAREREREK